MPNCINAAKIAKTKIDHLVIIAKVFAEPNPAASTLALTTF